MGEAISVGLMLKSNFLEGARYSEGAESVWVDLSALRNTGLKEAASMLGLTKTTSLFGGRNSIGGDEWGLLFVASRSSRFKSEGLLSYLKWALEVESMKCTGGSWPRSCDWFMVLFLFASMVGLRKIEANFVLTCSIFASTEERLLISLFFEEYSDCSIRSSWSASLAARTDELEAKLSIRTFWETTDRAISI